MSADFLDTNILIDRLDERAEAKRSTARSLVEQGLRHGPAVISYQVVQETLNAMTRKLGASPSDARAMFRDVLVPLWSISPSPDLNHGGLDIHDRYGYPPSTTHSYCRRHFGTDVNAS